jgi:hypothetical protein
MPEIETITNLCDVPCDPWVICVICRACQHTSGISPQEVAKRIGWGRDVRTVRSRLKCSKCKAGDIDLYAFVFPDRQWCCDTGSPIIRVDGLSDHYSVMTIEHSIMYWVCKHLGLELPQRGVVLDGDHPAVKWFAAHKAKLRDPKEVAKWLYSVVVKWGGAKTTPTALHAEDYKKVAVAQKSVFEEAMEHVFLRRDFEHIEGKTLYRVYTLLLKEASPGAYTRGRNKFLEDARDWLAKNRPDVVWEKVKVKTVEMGGSTTTMTTAFRVGVAKPAITRNDGIYIRVDDKGKESLRELRAEEDIGEVDTSLVT